MLHPILSSMDLAGKELTAAKNAPPQVKKLVLKINRAKKKNKRIALLKKLNEVCGHPANNHKFKHKLPGGWGTVQCGVCGRML